MIRKTIQTVQLHGDFAGREAVTFGRISGSHNIAIGRGAQTAVTRETDETTTTLFESAYRHVNRLSQTAGDNGDEVRHLLQALQEEAEKGSEADSGQLSQLLRDLAALSPDIFQTAAESLSRPEVEPELREIAQRARNLESNGRQVDEFEEIEQQLANSSLPAGRRNQLKDCWQRLQQATGQAESESIHEVRQALQEIISAMPELRQPLWNWLNNNSETAAAIKILARRLLT